MPESLWTKMGMIPTKGLEAWHELDGSTDGTTVLDYSGNGRDEVCLGGSPPDLQTDLLNGLPGLYFDGTNDPIAYSSAINLRHLFILAAYDGAAFAGAEGLLTSINTDAFLIGNGAASTKFANTAIEYRKSDVLYTPTNQLAPFTNVAILEVILPATASYAGLQVGRDRNAGTKWKGWYFFDLAYSEVKDDYERRSIYDYVAIKWHIWRRTVAGFNVFPFIPNKVLSSQSDRENYLSDPYSGDQKALVRGNMKDGFSLPFAQRHRREERAAKKFHAVHYPIAPFVFRDYRFDPPVDHLVKTSSPFNSQGADTSFRLNYSFEAADWEGEDIPTLPDGSFDANFLGMNKLVYDPLFIEADAFDRANHHGTQAISTIVDLQDDLDNLQDEIDSLSAGVAATSLDDLTDVTTPTPAEGDFLQYIGAQWVNRTVAQVITSLGLGDAMIFKGGIDCSGNPNYPAADAGNEYKVTVAGKIGGGSGPTVEIGDTLICTTDGTSAGTHGSVGANWIIVQTNLDIDTNGTLAANSDAKIATQKAVKTYADNVKPTESFIVAVSDESTTLTTGTAKVTFRMPYAFTLTAIRGSLSTVSSSGNPEVNIKEAGSTIFSTNLTIDASEKTSTTAATPAVISDASLADDAEITIDIVTAGTGAKGLKITFIGHRT